MAVKEHDPWDQDAGMAEWKREMRRRDRQQTEAWQAAYDQGLEDATPVDDDQDNGESASATSPTSTPRRSSAASPVGRVMRGRRAGSASNAILTLYALVIVRQWLAEGWPGVTRWHRAKFFNQTTTPAPVTTAAPANTSNGGGSW